MAVADLLWACPVCGRDRGLTRDDEARCTACGTRFQRVEGARIRAVAPDGTETRRLAREWVDRLPAPATLVQGARDGPVRAARVTARPVTSEARVFGEHGYLNLVEVFGDELAGELRLHRDRLIVALEPNSGAPASIAGDWPLQELTAVQASSSSLQVKRRQVPLVAFRFLDDSVYLWEQLLRAALRDFYGRTGRGVIREFQPRIVTR
ncbi:MAG: hypothetical protein ACOC3J_00920 [Gemmatimonadota bacterium]